MGARDRVVELKTEYPCLTLEAIGLKAGGITKQRVQQILISEGISTASMRPPKDMFLCNTCGKRFKKLGKASGKFCSVDCYKAYGRVTVECEWCHKQFKRHTSQVVRNTKEQGTPGHQFCSRKCFGHWTAEYHSKHRPTGRLATCLTCQRPFRVSKRHRKYCSSKCHGQLVGLTYGYGKDTKE